MAWNLDFWFKFGGLQFGGGGDINSFLGSLNSQGITRKSRYRVQIIPPARLSSSSRICGKN